MALLLSCIFVPVRLLWKAFLIVTSMVGMYFYLTMIISIIWSVIR